MRVGVWVYFYFLIVVCSLFGSVSSQVISTLDCCRAVFTKLQTDTHVTVWCDLMAGLTWMEWSWLVCYSQWLLTVPLYLQMWHHLVWTCSHMTVMWYSWLCCHLTWGQFVLHCIHTPAHHTAHRLPQQLPCCHTLPWHSSTCIIRFHLKEGRLPIFQVHVEVDTDSPPPPPPHTYLSHIVTRIAGVIRLQVYYLLWIHQSGLWST